MELVDRPVHLGIAALALFMIFALPFITYEIINFATKGDDAKEILTNEAYAAKRIGLVMGPLIAMAIPLMFFDLSVWSTLGWMAFAFVLAQLWGLAGHWLFSWGFLGKIDAGPFMETCLPVGYGRRAFAIGMGIIVGASLIGEAPTLRQGIASMLIFTALCAVVILINLQVFSMMIFGRNIAHLHQEAGGPTRRSLKDHMFDENPAAGPIAVGVILMTAILEAAALAGNFTNWGDAFQGFFLAFGIALVATVVIALLVDLFILKGINLWEILHTKNLAPAKTLRSWMVGIAIIVAPIVNQLVA